MIGDKKSKQKSPHSSATSYQSLKDVIECNKDSSKVFTSKDDSDYDDNDDVNMTTECRNHKVSLVNTKASKAVYMYSTTSQ